MADFPFVAEFSFAERTEDFFGAVVRVDFLGLEFSPVRFFAEVDEDFGDDFGLRDADEVFLFAPLRVDARVELVVDFEFFFTRKDPLVVRITKISSSPEKQGRNGKISSSL